MDYLESAELLLKNGIKESATRKEIARNIKYNKSIKAEVLEDIKTLSTLEKRLHYYIKVADQVIDLCEHELTKRPKFEVGDICRVIKNETCKSGRDIVGKLVILESVHKTSPLSIGLYGNFYYKTDGKPFGIWEDELELVARGKDFHKKS